MSLQPVSSQLLAEAFSDFISASARLELSYRDLQGEVQQLSRELAERNAALNASLAENLQMRRSLEQILDSMPCGVLVLDSEGRIRLANPEASRLLAVPLPPMGLLDEVLADCDFDLSPDCTLAEDGSEQELAFSSPTGARWLAVRRRSLPGWTGASISGAQDQTVLILRDVSLRRRMEAERDVARSTVALAEVSAILAHEIRNPLASMELFAGLIAESPIDSERWVSHLRAGIRSLSGTVNNVLTLHGESASLLERLDLRRELELAIDFILPLAAQAEVAVSFQADEGALLICGNKSAIQQIVLNLCSNALRHTKPGGSLRLCAGRSLNGIAVDVEDSGSGIPAEFLPRLFYERFSGSGSSSGLGLAVCGRLMRQHRGTIAVRSQPGDGSIFTLEFPSL